MERARVRVQEGVEEPERALPGGDQAVVDQGDDGREDGARAARAVDALRRTVHNNLEVGSDRRDVGVRAARGVELAAVGGTDGGEVALDGGSLVGRRAEVVGEAARGEGGGGLAGGARELCGANGGHAGEMDG